MRARRVAVPGRGAQAEIPLYLLSPRWHRTDALQAVTSERARGGLWGKYKMSLWRVTVVRRLWLGLACLVESRL